MKSLEKWLKNQGYKVQKIKLVGDVDCLEVDTDYTGMYPGKEQFEILNAIRQHVRRHYKDLKVESRGYYTAVYIY